MGIFGRKKKDEKTTGMAAGSAKECGSAKACGASGKECGSAKGCSGAKSCSTATAPPAPAKAAPKKK